MVRIIADTTCSLPQELMKTHGIRFVPQVVIFSDQAFHDNGELDTAAFLQKLRASTVLPKTAAPEPVLYAPLFEEAQKTGETLIVVAPSAKVSGTVRSVETAMQDFPDADVRIVDTQTIACNLGSLVLLANDLAGQGQSANEIIAALNGYIPRGRLYFVLDTLEYLRRGGRIGGAKALLGELLQVKPILQIREGQVQPFDQERTKKRAVARLIDTVCEQVKGSSDPHLCVLHVDAVEEAEALRMEISARTGIHDIPIYLLPPAIVAHAGPKALGAGFFA